MAVLFAIDNYPRGVASRLFGPVRDAIALATTLRSPRGGSWPDDHVISRLNGDATWTEFRRVIGALRGTFWGEVVIYLNGHGGETGFVFHDQEVSYARVGAVLNTVSARITLVWSDACMSGLGGNQLETQGHQGHRGERKELRPRI
jgi:hypothetical protein